MTLESSEMELEDMEMDPYSLFTFSIKSPLTKEAYLRKVNLFLDFLLMDEDPIEARIQTFVSQARDRPNWVFHSILKFIQKHKERVERRELSASTLKNYVKPLKLLCDVCNIPLNWKAINRGLPTSRKFANDRAPTTEELKKIMEFPDRRIKSIVLTMCSSGCRLGAWDYLRLGHITPIEREGKIIAAKIIIYAGEPEEYFSFITAEAYFELNKWMEHRKNAGEKISGDSWVMRHIWNTKNGIKKGLVSHPTKLKATGIKRIVEDALWEQGLRSKLETGKKRHPFQADHGMRKWFKTRCEQSGMRPIDIEILLSHSTGLSDSYYRPTETDLLESYLKAADSLTFYDESGKLQKQVSELIEKERQENYQIMKKLAEKEQELQKLHENDRKKDDVIACMSDKILKIAQDLEEIKKQSS